MNISRRTARPSRLTTVVGLALAALSLSAQAQDANPNAASDGQWVPGRLLVQPRPGLSEAEFDKILQPHGAKSVGKIEGIGVHILQLPPQASEKAVEALLKHNKHLKFVERDMLVPVEGTNDPYYANAWHLPKIGADTAWAQGSGAGVMVAILDTGVDGAHPDLANRMVSGWNVIDGNTNTADVHGHGTQVAGTAAATSENGIGVASVAGSAKIMPIRIADANGYASYSNIGKGLTWSADKGARVANISISGVAGSSTVRSAAQYMKDRGGLVVSGAGNSGGVENISATDTIISVSGTTSSDVKASWSSYGQYVDLAAPGAGIWTTKRGGSYGSVSGTSFAGPVVAGVLALMKEVNPKLNQTDLEKILLSTAVDLGTAGYDTMYGHGRVNAAAAVKTAAGSSTAADTSAPTVSVVSPAGGATVQGLVAVDVAASDNVGVSRVDLLVNGTRFASDTSAPYAFSWDSTKVADGGVTLTAQAFDAAGNYASRAVSVTVANASSSSESGSSGSSDTTAPIATISSPADGSTVSGYVVVSVSATDNVGVTATRLYIDGGLVKSGGSKFNYRWSTQKIAAGKHTVMVEAEDAAGNKGSRSVTVNR